MRRPPLTPVVGRGRPTHRSPSTRAAWRGPSSRHRCGSRRGCCRPTVEPRREVAVRTAPSAPQAKHRRETTLGLGDEPLDVTGRHRIQRVTDLGFRGQARTTVAAVPSGSRTAWPSGRAGLVVGVTCRRATPGGDGLDEGDHQGDLLAAPAESEADEHRDRARTCSNRAQGSPCRALSEPLGRPMRAPKGGRRWTRATRSTG